MVKKKRRYDSVPQEQEEIFKDASILQELKKNPLIKDDEYKDFFFPPYEKMEEKKKNEYEIRKKLKK